MAESHSTRAGKCVAIYVLRDAGNTERYIGKSVIPRQRFMQHRRDREWVSSYEILEWATRAKWAERERYWISFGKLLGWQLENKTDGGDGLRGVRLRESHKKRIAAKLIGNKNGLGMTISSEHRAAVSAAQKASWLTPERKANHPRGMLGKHGVWHGKTKETDVRLAEIARKASTRMLGHKPWNKGLTKSDPRVALMAARLRTSSSFCGINPWKFRKCQKPQS